MSSNIFLPNSSGNSSEKEEHARRGAINFIHQIIALMNVSSTETKEAINIEYLGQQPTQIGELFCNYYSDKASSHNYDILYNHIFKNKINTLLEIGMGTNNEDVLSNMTSEGKPGASLRAFRDYLPDAMIYGADVDSRILFQEDKIQTFFVDQCNYDTLVSLGNNLPDKIDVIIDDGLHSPEANLNVLVWALTKVSDGGWIVIEDIDGAALPVWQIVAKIISNQYETMLISAKSGYIFTVHKPS